MRKEFKGEVSSTITVHDSILMEVREDYVERVVHRIEEIMRHPQLFDTFNIKLTVPIEGECKIGAWGTGNASFEKWK